jgi:protein-S-isoprenylcysteine O-methyltransferase Ste14
MGNGYFIFIVLFLLSLAIRSSYELLKEAGKVNPENKLVFGFIFTAMCVLWVSWFALCPLDPFQFNLPDAVRWSGLALFVVGMILAIGALLQLRGLENIDHLITTGLFNRIRHPMYTGFGLWILGWSIFHGAFASLAVGLIGIANILFWRRLEDARLEARYGDTYRQYRSKTWF